MAKVPAVYDVTFQGIPGYWSGFDISKVDDDQLYHPYLLQRMLAISADIPGAMIGGQSYHRPGIPCWKHNKRRQIGSRAYHLVMTNSLPWKITIFYRYTIYKWAIYTRAMLNNQMVSPVFESRFHWVWDGFSQVRKVCQMVWPRKVRTNVLCLNLNPIYNYISHMATGGPFSPYVAWSRLAPVLGTGV